MSLHLLGSILYGNLFPIFLVVGVGYLIERLLHPDIQSASRLTFYAMSPCLVFDSLVRSQVGSDEMGRIGLVAVVVMLTTGGIAWLLARPLRLSPRQTSAFVLVAIFVNSGNYGLSLTELAFGEEALARAIVYFVMSTVLLYTLGVYIAALGGQGKGVGSALRSILRVPAVYALALAGLVRTTGFTLPLPLTKAVSLLGRAAIPVMLLILGMQLATISVSDSEWGLPGLTSLIRLVIAPLLALALVGLVGLDGAGRQATVVEASTPTAVSTIILALEFGLDATLVTGTVFLTTILSPITLTVLIAFLQA